MKPNHLFPAGAGAALLVILAATIVALSSGCVSTAVELPNGGGKLTRTSLLSNQSIGKVIVKLEGPDKGVTIEGYNQSGTEVARQALATAQAALNKVP